MRKEFLLILTCMLLLSSCGMITHTPTITPAPTPTPVNTYCPEDKVSAEFTQLDKIYTTFLDNYTVAKSTPRISLALIVTQLQSSQRDFEAVDVHDCLKKFHDDASMGMKLTIQALVAFLGEEANTTVSDLTAEATKYFFFANNDRSSFQTCFPNCKP